MKTIRISKFQYSLPRQLAGLCAMLILSTGLQYSCVNEKENLWTKTVGGSDADWGYAVQKTKDGGYIFAGITSSFGAGDYDVYLIRANANGDTLWTKTYGGTRTDKAYSVQQNSEGGFIVVGNTESFGAGDPNVYLICTDADGFALWTKTYGGSIWDGGMCVQQTKDGGYIVVGNTESYGAGRNDIYLFKTDAKGVTLWTKTFGGADDDKGYSVQQTNDDGFIVAGYTESFGAGKSDVYLIKTNENGDSLWTKTYGSSSWEHSNSVQQTNDGGYIIAGKILKLETGNSDVYLIRTDENGDTLWTKTYGGDGQDEGYFVQQTSEGGYIVAGETWSLETVSADGYLIRTDANGDTLWTKTFGGNGTDNLYSVLQTSEGGFIITTGATESFGAGSYDVLLIKTDANGNTLPLVTDQQEVQ
ncbi:MAG: hypothetical protein FVQ77_07160 [Cytophagales bacterium]|nr:hypothetical protein [Cytophagales bacterium]